MAMNNHIHTKFGGHFHSSWVVEDCEVIASPDGLLTLYDRLISNKEITVLPQQAINLRGPTLADFEHDSITLEEQEHLINALLGCQRNLARIVSSLSPFSQCLQKRLIVLQRIYHAISTKHHTQGYMAASTVESPTSGKSVDIQGSSLAQSSLLGNDALLELGVKTGLNLLFSLLRQNWMLASQTGQYSFCNDILQTAIATVISFPPLSLANEAKVTPLGIESLNQVNNFLRLASGPHSGADLIGQRMASELMLALAAQRGSLRFVLEWIDMAMRTSVAVKSSQDKEVAGKIQWEFFVKIVTDMIRSVGGSEVLTSSMARNPPVDGNGLVSLYFAAVVLLEELCHLAADYASNCCVGPDENSNTSMTSNSNTNMITVTVVTSEAYVWGSNSSHQLAEGTQEKILTPKHSSSFTDCAQIEAGQFCSFIIYNDGSVGACGKGSYGRLGLGDSNNHTVPKKLTFEPKRKIKKVSSSKGSDGHTLALSVDGDVFSWGDGDYGKLGHGTNSTQKYPKLVQGPLSGKVVKCVAAGYRHSAAVTEDGELYTWGEGDYGRLGHGDSNSKNFPTKVKDIGMVGQVACGSSHTLVVSQNGKSVWSFGGGDNGKLGHGDTNRQYKPKLIEAFVGMYIRKVACGSQSSMALTSSGQLYAWGFGCCLGCGSAEYTALRPRLVEDLQTKRIVDFVRGDSHVLALSHDNEVYAWGNNAMGQCGQGHAQSPITRPKKVIGLDGINIHQISAGTSHSVAWTSLPTDRHVTPWYRPFCVDLQEATFSTVRSFLENFCVSFDEEQLPAPFIVKQDHYYFVQLCLKMLSTHLSLAIASGMTNSVLGQQAAPLRNMLFRLIDSDAPSNIREIVTECLSVGAPLLLPSLRERMELLHSLLPQGQDRWDSLSRGQQMQLNIILTSLHDNNHIAALLGFTDSMECMEASQQAEQTSDLHLAEILMKTILRNLAQETEQSLNELEKNMDKKLEQQTYMLAFPHLHNLLSSLHKHLLAYCYIKPSWNQEVLPPVTLLHQHVSLMLPVATNLYGKALELMKREQCTPDVMSSVEEILYHSPAGAMLFHILNALLLLPLSRVNPLLHELMPLLSILDHVCRVIPRLDQLEAMELEEKHEEIQERCVWLVDMERTCATLIGLCLGGMLVGEQISQQEKSCLPWLDNPIFGSGASMSAVQTDDIVQSFMVCIKNREFEMDRVEHMDLDTDTLALLEFCCGQKSELTSPLWETMLDHAKREDWDTCDVSEEDLDTLSRCLLAALLKHCNLIKAALYRKSPPKSLLSIFRYVYRVRGKLMQYRKAKNIPDMKQLPLICDRSDGTSPTFQEVAEMADVVPPETDRSSEQEVDQERDETASEGGVSDDEGTIKDSSQPVKETSFEDEYKDYLHRSVFLLLGVRAAITETPSLSCSQPLGEIEIIAGDVTESPSSDINSGKKLDSKVQRRGSEPDLSGSGRDFFASAGDVQSKHTSLTMSTRDGTSTPNHTHEAMNLGSLQRVKESLRRLRWQQERARGITHGSHHPHKKTFAQQIGTDVCRFVCGESHMLVPLSADQDSITCWKVDPREMSLALEHQQMKAESRLYSLNQIKELLSTNMQKPQEDSIGTTTYTTPTTLLFTAHIQLLTGCFSFGSSKEMAAQGAQLYHYQDEIRSAKTDTQQEIQLLVHQIYDLLVSALIETEKLQNIGPGAKQKLLLWTVYSLTMKYGPSDISLAVACGLLPLLFRLSDGDATLSYLMPLQDRTLKQKQLDVIVNISSSSLLKLITLTSSTCAEKLGVGVVQGIMDLLWNQLTQLWHSNTKHQLNNGSSQLLRNFLLFLRRVATSSAIQKNLLSKPWISMLLSVAGRCDESGCVVLNNLRTRLVALTILEMVLASVDKKSEENHIKEIVESLFECLSDNMWKIPQHLAKQQAEAKKDHLHSKLLLMSNETTEGNEKDATPVVMQNASFDLEKCLNCSVENPQTLVHSSAGKGYGLGTTAMVSGCYKWKVLIVKENKENEGTCVGVSKWPVRDYTHRTTTDMWLYRAYSGNLYHGGEQPLALQGFTQGDYITVILDMDARTLAFGKNGEDPRIAFEDIDATELYPCVMFYSGNPGEKVKMTDMQICEVTRELLPGDPICAPVTTVMVEAYISLLRGLHKLDIWTPHINKKMLQQFEKIKVLEKSCKSKDKDQQETESTNMCDDKDECDKEKEDKKESATELDVDDEESNFDFSDEETLKRLCTEVWPSLVLIGGMDPGLRVGGRCLHKTTSKKGTLMGVTREGTATVKVHWDDGDNTASDVLLSKIDPIESETFDANLLSGLSAHHLESIMKLASMANKGPQLHHKVQKLKPTTREKKESDTILKRFDDALMRELDDDIARVLDQESPPVSLGIDHNADKKSLQMAPLVSLENFDLDSTEDSCSVNSSSPLTSPRTDDPDDGGSEVNRDQQGVAKLETLKIESESSDAEMKYKSNIEAEMSHCRNSDVTENESKEILKLAEFQTMQRLFVHVTAMKALSVIIHTNKFTEKLLVPKSDLMADSSKALVDGTIVRRDEDIKCAIRSLMRRMVKLALGPTILLRVFSVAEQERALSVLYKVLMTSEAEEEVGVSELQEKFDAKCNQRSESEGKTSKPSSSKKLLQRIQSENDFQNLIIPPPQFPDLSTAMEDQTSQGEEENRLPSQTSILQFVRRGSESANQRLSRHLFSRMSRREGSHPPEQISLSNIDSVNIPPQPPPLRRSPPPPQRISSSLRGLSSRKPPHPPVRARSPSPPPPPIATPLLEMGFSMQAIKKAIQETGVNSREVSVSSSNTLALWMLEHPDENGTGPEIPPVSKSNSNTSNEQTTRGGLDSVERRNRRRPLTLTEDIRHSSDESNEDHEVQGSLFVRRPRQITRTRHVDLRSFINNIGNSETSRTETQRPSNEAMSLSDFYERRIEQLDAQSNAVPMSLVDLYDNILELQDEIFNDDEIEDLFNTEAERADSFDLYNALRGELEEQTIVTCELCQQDTTNFNRHMKTEHPGCGGSCGHHGYRSNGVYVDGWFGGRCGTGHPFFLMCQDCRDRYKEMRGSQTPEQGSSADVKSGLAGSYQKAPDLLEIIDQGYLDPTLQLGNTGQSQTPVESIEIILSKLGLSDRKPAPEPLRFTDTDPLGASLVRSPQSSTDMISNLSSVAKSHKVEHHHKSLGEQAANIRSSSDRQLALYRITSAMQVMLARSMVMKVLSVLAGSGPTCSLPAALDYIGLSDILLIVQLMCLCATGKVVYPVSSSPRDVSESLANLTTAIGALVQDNPSSLKQLVHLCTQELMLAAMGGHKGDVKKKTKNPKSSVPSSTFPVTQALVSLLTQNTWSSTMVRSMTASKVKVIESECVGGTSTLPLGGTAGNITTEETVSHPLLLINALSACILSTKLPVSQKQWAMKQLLQSLSSQSVPSGGRQEIYADLSGDLPYCQVSRLEAHQNRLVNCSWSSKKSLLATSGYDGTVRVWSLPNKTHQILQQTYIFNQGDDVTGEDLDGHLLAHSCWSSTGKFLAGSMDNIVNIWTSGGSRGHLDTQPHWVTALSWPQQKGILGGCLGLATDTLLVGRLDGSLAYIDALDSSSYRRHELEHCYRRNVSVTQIAWYCEDKPFAVGFSDGVVSLCTKLEFEQPVITEAYQSSISCLKWDPIGHTLATCGEGQEDIKIWLPGREGLTLIHLLPHVTTATTVQWCDTLGKGDNKQLMLASGSNDGAVHVWIVQQQKGIETHLSPFGIMSETIYQETEGESDEQNGISPSVPVLSLKGHMTNVTSLEFSPNALMLASGCSRGWLNIWSLADGSLLQTHIENGTINDLCWFADHGLAACFARVKDVVILHNLNDSLSKHRSVAMARKSLKSQGIVGLTHAPCFQALLCQLPTILQDQYTFEKPKVVSGQQLVHSQYMQSLAILAVGLKLEKALCFTPIPPHHKNTTHDKEMIVTDWQWLLSFSVAIKSAEALASRTKFPEAFKMLSKDLKEIKSSSWLHVCGFLT